MVNDRGIVLLASNPVAERRAETAGLPVVRLSAPEVPFQKTLIVGAATRVPFDLLPAAWNYLDRWDVAVPLWRMDRLAANMGDAKDRARTEAITLDLRVPLHSCELLFVRAGGAGEALVFAWLAEQKHGGDPRLAFLRALHIAKPMVCFLPSTWLAEVREQDRQAVRRGVRQPAPSRPLVRVEVSPGQFVRVYQGDEEKALANYRRSTMKRKV